MSDLEKKARKFSNTEGNQSSKLMREVEYDTGRYVGYLAGFKDCEKEYEEKLRWIPVEEKIPEFNDSEYPNGNFEEYEVKFCTGGMSPKYFIRISHLINKAKFSGEFDWTHATHWRRIL